ncbi:MAG: metal ABC transporter permease, partial [Firmicutes bacterium]|nr:metal ABC transporter permease [Bacillota bacterium]
LAATLLYWVFVYNPLLLTSVSETLAASRGVRTRLMEAGFACLLAVVVMLSIRWVGVLIISAMLVLPSASARNVARNVRRYHLFAVLIALVCGILGLLLSFAWGTASGATIVLALAACYAASLLIMKT